MEDNKDIELVRDPADVLKDFDNWKKKMKQKSQVYAKMFDLYNAMFIFRESRKETLTGVLETYYIKVYKATPATSILIEKPNTDLATSTGIKCYGHTTTNIDQSTTGFRFTYKNGMLDSFSGNEDLYTSFELDTGNGWGHPDNDWNHPTLVHSSVPLPDFPGFSGGTALNSTVRNIHEIVKSGFASMEKVRFKGYINCDKKTAYFVFWNHKPNDKYFDERYGNYIRDAKQYVFLGHRDTPDYGTDSYIGNGQKSWKYEKAMDNGVHIGYLKGPKTSLSSNQIIYTNNLAIQDRLLKMGYQQANIKYVKHPREIPEPDGGYDCSGLPWPPEEGDKPIKDLAYFPLKTNRFLKYKDPFNANMLRCYTFNHVSDLGSGNFTLAGTNGRMIDYVNDNGCWHQNYAKPDRFNMNMKDYSEISTNSENLKNIFTKVGIKHSYYKNDRPDNFPYEEYISQLWGRSKRLYFASWTEGQGGQEGDIILIAFDRAENDGTVLDSDAWRLPKQSQGQWKDKWVPEWENKESAYGFGDGKKRYVRFSTNHRNLYGYLTRHNMLDDKAKYISPCTDPLPDGSLPPGVQGPNLPPDVKPPGAGGDDPIGPPAPQPIDPSAPITDSSITCIKQEDLSGTKANDKLNGLYYYYLEQELFQTEGNRDNTSILGTTEAICNISYAPFYNIGPQQLCKVPFDTKRYGEFEGAGVPWVYRIVSHVPKEMHIASWNVYPKGAKPATGPGTPWKWSHESRLLDFPYRRCVFYSNVFDAYEVIPHLHHQSSGSLTMDLKTCCAATPGGNFYAYVKGYKGDTGGFIERQFSNASMDIPNTSSAYSNYMSSQKAQASVGLQQSALSSMNATVPALAGTMLAAAAIPGVNVAMVGAAAIMGAAGSGGISTLQSMQQNMAYRQDLMTTPKSLKSMGGDVMARLGCAGKATVISCDMVITDMYKDMLARFFQMYGTKQNRVLDVQSNIMSRYYYNYIKTVGCNISANGVPKKHVAIIKQIMDKGATFWHLDRNGVNYGEYCVYDNCEV